jgi:enterochelin esterase family protein
LLAAPAAVHAQPDRGGRGIGGNTHTVRSPDIGADYRVTFRLLAPNAQAVSLMSDFTGDTLKMTKAENGVWSYTTDAIKPGYYQYWFEMDGLTMPDPVNSYVRPASGVYKSQIDLPGAGTEWMDFRDVPHGALHEHWYVNKQNGTARRVVIYTPPGYNKSTVSYPVVYLLHGNADYERGWTQTGRANLIMDNLLADGKATPAIIVMPFGHDVSGSTGKYAEVNFLQKELGVTPTNFTAPPLPATGPITSGSAGFTGTRAGNPGSPGAPTTTPAAPGARGPGAPAVAGGAARGAGAGLLTGGARGGAPGGAASYMENDLLNLVVPLVEKEYRVKTDKASRAIVGYSMGGMQATTIGLTHPELFAYVGAFSAPSGGGLNRVTADPAKANQDFKLIWVGCGTEDTTAYTGSKNLHETLAAAGVKHEWVESPGYLHDYQIWRIYLHDVLPKLFRD